VVKSGADFGLPITRRGLLTLAGIVLPMRGLAFNRSPLLGHWLAYAHRPVAGFVVWLVPLALAQAPIGESVKVGTIGATCQIYLTTALPRPPVCRYGHVTGRHGAVQTATLPIRLLGTSSSDSVLPDLTGADFSGP
jgi:hypothetical protein